MSSIAHGHVFPRDVPTNALSQKELDSHMNERFSRMDVVDLYSPPRVSKSVGVFGLFGGLGLNLTTVDEKGRPWDPSKQPF